MIKIHFFIKKFMEIEKKRKFDKRLLQKIPSSTFVFGMMSCSNMDKQYLI